MSFNLAGLAQYTSENTELLSQAILSTEEIQNVAIRTGVSAGTSSINVFSGTITEQDRDCDMTPAGQLTFDQIPVTVADKAIAQNLCPTELRAYWMSEQMKPGAAGGEELVFEEVIANYVATSIQQNISTFIGTELLTQVTVANGAQSSAQAVASTVATIIDDLNDVYDALDERVKMMDDIKIFLSPSLYRMAVRALVAANSFNYAFGDGEGDVMLPGTTAKLVKAQGFIGTQTIMAFPSKYVIFATGLLSDEETINMPYNPYSDQVALRAYYRRGLGVYSVDQVAVNGL